MSANLFLLLVLAPLALLTTIYVIWPLLRRTADAGAGGDAGELNREIVRERRAQLDRELALLPPDSAERDRLILEFSAAALTDLEPGHGPARRSAPQRWVTAALLAGMLVVGPLALYRIAGAPDAASPDFAQLSAPPDLDTLVAQLEQRLKAEPGSAEGWLLLGRSKTALGDLPGATAALERALAVDSPVPGLAAQIRVDLADALAQGAASKLTGRPWSLIQDALTHDGANQKALALAGAYQVSQANPAGSLSYWEPLLAQLPPSSEQHAQIAAFIADLKAGRRPGAGAAPGASPAAGAGPAAGSATGSAAGATTTTAAGPVLRGRIEIDAALASQAKPDDTLFVAVRGLDKDGRPAGPPAAVLRARVADLPLDFQLSDSHAMSPAATLSGQTRVVVVARVSRAGTAVSSPGDFEGRSPVVAPDAQGVQVRIDRVLP